MASLLRKSRGDAGVSPASNLGPETTLLVRETTLLVREATPLVGEATLLVREAKLLVGEAAHVTNEGAFVLLSASLLIREGTLLDGETTLAPTSAPLLSDEVMVHVDESALALPTATSPSSINAHADPSVTHAVVRDAFVVDGNAFLTPGRGLVWQEVDDRCRGTYIAHCENRLI